MSRVTGQRWALETNHRVCWVMDVVDGRVVKAENGKKKNEMKRRSNYRLEQQSARMRLRRKVCHSVVGDGPHLHPDPLPPVISRSSPERFRRVSLFYVYTASGGAFVRPLLLLLASGEYISQGNRSGDRGPMKKYDPWRASLIATCADPPTSTDSSVRHSML
jgi:hypothetical protein